MADFAILVLTLRRRRPYLARLMRRLEPQLCSRCRVFTYEEHEELPIGHRRQILLESSRIRKKQYLAWIDDDDIVAPNYVATVLAALEQKPDVVGFRQWYYVDGRLNAEAIISAQCRSWETVGGVHYRTPNHLSPIRRQLAQEIGFKRLQSGEDVDYSVRLMNAYPSIKEVFVDEHLYTYLFRSPTRRCETPDAQVPDLTI